MVYNTQYRKGSQCSLKCFKIYAQFIHKNIRLSNLLATLSKNICFKKLIEFKFKLLKLINI
jgi:hypothetical protein